MRIVLSSFNRNKYLELNHVGSQFGHEILLPQEIKEHQGLCDFQETNEIGSTYKENALLKASECASWCKLISLGDDSGLEVDALNGAPGLHSKRYADTDSKRIEKLVRELHGKIGKERSCRFRSVLALHNPLENSTFFSEGILEGEVLLEPKGERGFGYDPIIFIYELGCTLAEIDNRTLFEKGFRAKAAQSLFTTLSRTIP